MSTESRYQRVMFIDDNELDNFINKTRVESENFAAEIQPFLSSSEALAYLQTHASSPELLPDIIFLDIIMPGMDGFGFLEAFDKLPDAVKSKSRIVMLSTSDSFKDLNRANQNKFVRKFLNKPLSPAMLKAINF